MTPSIYQFKIGTDMKAKILIGLGQIIVGAVTGNPVQACSGAAKVILGPMASDVWPNTDWVDIAENCPFW